MRLTRITATTLLTLAVTGLSAGLAPADPTPDQAKLDLSGTVEQIGYRVSADQDRRAAVTTVEGGRFELVEDDRVVTLTDRAGQVVAAFPMAIRLGDKQVDLTPLIEADGTRLTLAPAADESAPAPLRDINAEERFFAEVERHKPAIITGAVIGGAIGFVLGLPLGLFVLDFITVPVGTVVGAAIGAFAGLAHSGGQPAIDAAVAYMTRTP
ncbi:hypothetical protein IU485_12105 [Nocardia cyriacigeorgica]|uniref:hypothetical protein n=1 Tax=Nocardia cyriacigeorgica TaxID=135487 RepID=UPI0018953C97|nr:hypothetical protein [Nocardia cyriacigeorgica]MBF6082103.1 hypothetical protein [Nocardia cyriacigeorgica]